MAKYLQKQKWNSFDIRYHSVLCTNIIMKFFPIIEKVSEIPTRNTIKVSQKY